MLTAFLLNVVIKKVPKVETKILGKCYIIIVEFQLNSLVK